MNWNEFKARVDELMEKEGIDPEAPIRHIDVLYPGNEAEVGEEVSVRLIGGEICI